MGLPSSPVTSMTLADQVNLKMQISAETISFYYNYDFFQKLKSRLEERRRSREGVDGSVTTPIATAATPPSSSFVPESIAVDIQRAVQVANESSEFLSL